VIAAVVIAGCGGSKHTGSSTGPATTSSTASTPSTSTPTGSESTPAATTPTTGKPKRKPRAPASGGASVSGGGGGSSGGGTSNGGGGSPGTKVSKPAGGATNARVPATFTIGRAGAVSPSTVSAPAFLAIQLTVISGDGRPHHVVVQTQQQMRVSVPANGKATVLLAGLKAGDYTVQIDGQPKAKLVIGGEPGP
jgi:hypothetical protein